MHFNTFLFRFGLNPDDFEPFISDPIQSDTGFIYYLDQDHSKIPCPFCKSDNIGIKGYYRKDINCSDSVHVTDTVKVKMIRFKCKCCNKTFNKPLHGIKKYSSISNLSIKTICLDFHLYKSFDQISKKHHISKTEVIRIFDEHIPSPKRLPLPEVLCIDEFHFSSKSNEKYCVILVNWQTKEIIDIIRNRKLPYLREYFSQIDDKELKKVKYFVSDLYDGYRTIHKEFFSKSHHIADFYHITIQLSRALNVLRTQVMKQLNPSSIEYKFMKKYWSYFISRSSFIPSSKIFKTKSNQEAPFFDLFIKCVKLNDNLWNGYDCLQDLFSFQKDQFFSDAVKHFEWLSNKLSLSSSQLLIDVAKTYSKWSIEIGNAYSFHPGYKNISNAIAESTNNKIKTIIKDAYGFSCFERFRKRALLLLRH